MTKRRKDDPKTLARIELDRLMAGRRIVRGGKDVDSTRLDGPAKPDPKPSKR